MYDQDLIALIDQRVRAAQQTTRAAGTCVTRATTGPDAQVVFDGSTVAMPVKVLGTVFLQAGDRCVLDKYGSDWVVTGSWASLGLGEASKNQFGVTPGITTTSSTFVDVTQVDPFTFTKIYDGTYVRIGTSCSCYSTVASTRVRFGLRLTPQDAGSSYTATDLNLSFIHFNVASTHLSQYGLLRMINIPAGAYTCQLRWRRSSGTGTLSIDDGDLFHIELDEGIRQLTPFL